MKLIQTVHFKNSFFKRSTIVYLENGSVYDDSLSREWGFKDCTVKELTTKPFFSSSRCFLSVGW